MHPIIKTLLLSALIGLAFGGYLFFTFDHRPERIIRSVLYSVDIGSLMMLTIYHRHYFTNMTPYPGVKVIIMIMLLTVAALLGTEITFILESLLSIREYTPFDGGSIYILNILIVMVVAIPLYASEEWKNMANARLLQQQYRVLQLEQQQTVFELELLRAKINPHFLYNMHNTIAGLISIDPIKAEELVLLLSKFLRFTLNKDSTTFHSVKDELDIIATYLHMQQIRYNNRMSYKITAAPESLHLKIPSFILQPLVENAVKHGIEPSTANGFIDVNISLHEDTMVIRIADTGPAFSQTPGSGMGLQIVMNKLRLLYAEDFKIELNNIPEKYVRLVLPATNHHLIGG